MKAAAEERIAEAAATERLARLWTGLDKAPVVSDPRRALQQLAGALTDMADKVGADIDELKSLEVQDDKGRLRGKVLLFVKLVDILRGVLTDMNRLGLAEQVVQLERDQARHVGLAVEDGLEAMGGVLTLAGVPASVMAEGREVFVAAMMRRMRVEAGEVPAP